VSRHLDAAVALPPGKSP